VSADNSLSLVIHKIKAPGQTFTWITAQKKL
ncbi:MAG: hypothetical protein ACI94Z_002610, partial [Yoonia sp.]